MAYEVPGFKLGVLLAGENLAAKQHHFVKLHTDGTVKVCAAVTDDPLGILQNDPALGEACEIMCDGVSKVIADAQLTVGQKVGSSADGQAAPYVDGTDTTKYIVGKVLTAAGAASEVATIVFSCLGAGRGA